MLLSLFGTDGSEIRRIFSTSKPGIRLRSVLDTRFPILYEVRTAPTPTVHTRKQLADRESSAVATPSSSSRFHCESLALLAQLQHSRISAKNTEDARPGSNLRRIRASDGFCAAPALHTGYGTMKAEPSAASSSKLIADCVIGKATAALHAPAARERHAERECRTWAIMKWKHEKRRRRLHNCRVRRNNAAASWRSCGKRSVVSLIKLATSAE